jgi:hypothetical protein
VLGDHISHASGNLLRVSYIDHVHRRPLGESRYRSAQRFLAPSECCHRSTPLAQERGRSSANAGSCAGDDSDVA